MLVAADDVEGRLVVAAQPAAQRIQARRRLGVVVGIDEPSTLCLGQAFHQPSHGCLVRGPEEHVFAGTQGRDGIDDLGGSLGQGAHVQGIGDGHAVEPQLLAQEVAQHRP